MIWKLWTLSLVLNPKPSVAVLEGSLTSSNLDMMHITYVTAAIYKISIKYININIHLLSDQSAFLYFLCICFILYIILIFFRNMDLFILTECVCVSHKSCQVMSNKAESLFHSVFLIVDVIKAQPPFCKFQNFNQSWFSRIHGLWCIYK